MTNFNQRVLRAVFDQIRKDEFNETDHPRDEAGRFTEGSGIEKDKYGNIMTKEKLAAPADFMSRGGDAPLKLNPDHEQGTVILTHNGTHLGSAEHVGGKWQATTWSRDIQAKHLEILNRAAPRGLRDIEPEHYTTKGERKGQTSLF